jgi:hypothetical protein
MTEARKEKQPLDDIMLAMDVVDTLRHQQLLVERELKTEDRDQKMMQRLREIYASQGIEVTDRVLEQGVAALKEGRFVYDPPRSSIQTGLARLYISRSTWGKPLLIVLSVVLVVWLAYATMIRGPAQRAVAALPAELESRYENLSELAVGPLARDRSNSLLADGKSALKRDDKEDAEQVLERMAALQKDIELEYDLRVAAHPGEKSGVWRIPDANTNARNYYIIVEAVSRYGNLEKVPVLNEEDGKTYRVKKWGLRVDREVFEKIAADKTDDGIIQDNRFGVKKRGYLTPEYLMPTTGRAITKW